MRINKVNIPQSQTIKCLREVKIEKLGSVVALIGKNGAGKSRILEMIKAYPNNISFYEKRSS